MSVHRVFIDWGSPALAAAIDYLVERFGTPGVLDLDGVVLALPGGRSGRRLLEILVAEGERRSLRLCPPRIVTAGGLPELLYERKRPFAGNLVQHLAWVEALRTSDPRLLQAVAPVVPGAADLPAWLALGEMLGRLHRELAAEALDFADVAERGSQIEGFRETARWRALAEIQKQYLRTLDGLDLWDLQTARLVAIRNRECKTEAHVVLLGAVDLNRAERLMLDQVADWVTALVPAPAEMANRFDEHGCVRPAEWLTAAIPLTAEQMEVVDAPADEAEAALQAIAGFDGRYNTEQIAIGVPDEQIVPYLQQQFQQCGLRARYGAGMPLLRSSPYRLLAAVADYLETSSFPAFAALLRHPAVHDWLLRQRIPGDWLSQLDRYHADHLPYRLDGKWQGDQRQWNSLELVRRSIEKLCQGLRGQPRPMDQWARPIVDLLVAVLGGAALDATVEADRIVLAACESLHDVLGEYAAIPAGLAPSLGSSETTRLLLREVEGERIAAPPDRGAIEILGWLELPLDDAPALIVTGFNEGHVPSSLNADLFLPNHLRRALGIEDNDRRYARDAYALSLLAASRRQLRLIAGRRGGDGDPLLPSRLLFACDAENAARRVQTFFAGAEGTREKATVRFSPERSRLDVPRPQPLARPITSMRVTEFRDYLACPYRYYLQHVLKLEVLADSAAELDGAAFGSLAHAVLHAFGKGPLAASTDVEAIRADLDQLLDESVGGQYGKAPMPSILVQVEQLRLRLAAFAGWQAGWAGQGWRIEHVETGPAEGKASIVVDGQPMALRGRIDRIDVHEPSGRRMIFDYKSSDQAKTPDQAHRRKGQWIDLQLPLYRQLAAGLGIAGPVELAYIVLPKDTGCVEARKAGWTAEDFASADQAAAEVVRNVRNEKFWPPVTPPPAFSEQFAAICQDDRFGAILADEESGGDPNP
jgi:RecB family exonuclease